MRFQKLSLPRAWDHARGVWDVASEAYGELSGSGRDGLGISDAASEVFGEFSVMWAGVPGVLDVASEAYVNFR
jgi:hypothetical protein